MTTFVYRAKKNTAETVTGHITAQNQDEAIDLINQLGLLPVSVEEQKTREGLSDGGIVRRIRVKDLYFFSRQLANLLKSGVTLLRALKIMGEQSQNLYLQKIITVVESGVKNGRTFSDCLAQHPRVFSPLYITMVKAGEESGNLQEMLLSIANYQRKQVEILSKVRSALAYPLFMAGAGVATILFIFMFVLPRMSGLFENIGSLPLPTAILLNLSHGFQKAWYLIIFLFLLIVFFSQKWLKTTNGRSAMSRFILRMPAIGEIILRMELARFCRTLVLLLKSGVNITKALEISIPLLSNDLIKEDLSQCKEDLLAGGSLGVSLQESRQIPQMMGHLIAVGEESGSLNEVLSEIAEEYEQDTDEKIKTMTSLFEPMMILAVGLIVGFLVFAMLLPIFQMDVLSK